MLPSLMVQGIGSWINQGAYRHKFIAFLLQLAQYLGKGCGGIWRATVK